MYNRMLVPLDGSEIAEVVFPYAEELAGRLDLEVVLLHANSSEERGFTAMQRVYVEWAAAIVRHQSREVQERTGIQPGGKAVEVRVELVVGDPAEQILRYADESEIDLILMATHGRSGIRRWAIGSVVDKVLRASRVPILLVRAGIPEEVVHDEWSRRTMLVPLDGSMLAESVLPHVKALAKQRGVGLMDVVPLWVCQPPVISSDYPADMPLSWEEHVRWVTTHSKQVEEQYLTGVQKRLEGAGLKVRSEVLMGKAADEIVDYADRNPLNLIVMATHGYSGLSRWECGSVADKVLHAVSSPIFVVRPH